MQPILYTIGYEGSEIEQFLLTLQECGIEHVIDIRDVPVSRKRGFSKTSLATALTGRGIGYTHLKALGDPKAGRMAMRNGDFPAFLEIYTGHLATREAQGALRDAVCLAEQHASALLCFERSPKECHRTIVADEMRQIADFKVQNVGVNTCSHALKIVQPRSARLAHPPL